MRYLLTHSLGQFQPSRASGASRDLFRNERPTFSSTDGLGGFNHRDTEAQSGWCGGLSLYLDLPESYLEVNGIIVQSGDVRCFNINPLCLCVSVVKTSQHIVSCRDLSCEAGKGLVTMEAQQNV